MAMKKIATFDDWIDAFRARQKDISLRLALLSQHLFRLREQLVSRDYSLSRAGVREGWPSAAAVASRPAAERVQDEG